MNATQTYNIMFEASVPTNIFVEAEEGLTKEQIIEKVSIEDLRKAFMEAAFTFDDMKNAWSEKQQDVFVEDENGTTIEGGARMNAELEEVFTKHNISKLWFSDVVGAGETECVPYDANGNVISIKTYEGDGGPVALEDDEWDEFWNNAQQGCFDLVGTLVPNYSRVKGWVIKADNHFTFEEIK